MSTTRTIVVKGNGMRKEREANAAITPGMLLEIDSSNEVGPVGTADTHVGVRVAVENEVLGRGVDDNYASGDWVLYEVLRSGDEFYALVAAGAAAITLGDALNVTATGTVATAAEAPENLAFALESVDNSGGGTATWILCEVI